MTHETDPTARHTVPAGEELPARTTAAAAARLGGDVSTAVVPEWGTMSGIGQPVALIAVLRLLVDRW